MISMKWVNDYVDIKDEDLKELALRITASGINVESIITNKIDHLVIGEVVECINHPDSDHLHVCKVNVGTDELQQIVCGAPNVRENLKVIVALPGAILPGDFEIKKSKIRGVESNGMLCALYELGLVEKTEELYAKGIEELGSDAKVGEDPLTYLGYDDTAYDLDLNPNRWPDCTNHIGFAYEVAAVTGKKVNMPSLVTNPINESVLDLINVDIDTDNVKMYNIKMVKNVEIKESPDFIKRRLITAGMRPINNVVDISNYVMLEYGQPLHFYDADKLGNNIVVRDAADKETITTLDGNEHTLCDKDIVIADNEKAIGIAGVMGGLSTMVDENTKNIVIESAIFNPFNIRYTSIRENLRSEASLRLEKPLSAEYCEQSIERACHLLEKYAEGQVLTGTICFDEVDRTERVASVTTEEVNAMLGVSMSDSDVENSLNKLNFTYKKEKDNYIVTIPNRRLDVEAHKSDLIEEIGRLYGYDNIKPVLPSLPTKKGEYLGNIKLRKQVSKRLRSLGLNETRTYMLQSMEEFNLFPYNRGELIKVDLPMSSDKEVVRQSLLATLLKVVDYNNAHGTKDINIYEIANTYSDLDKENTKLAIVLKGNMIDSTWNGIKLKSDFYTIKGIAENILDYLGFKNRYSFVVNDELKDMHPGMSAEILLDRNPIGFIGRVHPSIRKDEVYVMEISLTAISELKVKPIKYKEPSKYPEVKKDLAFIVNKDVTSIEIENVIKKAGGRLLVDIDVFDVYTGENVKEDEKSIAYSLVFNDPTRTLNDVEVTEIFNRIINEVETKLNAKLRNK